MMKNSELIGWSEILGEPSMEKMDMSELKDKTPLFVELTALLLTVLLVLGNMSLNKLSVEPVDFSSILFTLSELDLLDN